MFCTKCSAEMLDSDIFCPRCGAPRKIRSGTVVNEELIKNTVTIDVTPEDEPDYIGHHNRPSVEDTYSGYYGSLENTKKKKAGSCFARFILILFLAVLIIAVLLCGVLLIRGENPIEYAKEFISSVELFKQSPASDGDTASDANAVTETDLSVIATTTTTTITTTMTTTTTTTMNSTTKTTTTTKKTTTTTKPTTTTTKSKIGQQVRETSVGKWKADVSALGLSVVGSKIKTVNITIDKNGNADVSLKVGFVTVKTKGSFTVEDDGKTNLTIEVPYTGEIVKVVGYSKVVNNDQIVFRCSEGDITLNRR